MDRLSKTLYLAERVDHPGNENDRSYETAQYHEGRGAGLCCGAGLALGKKHASDAPRQCGSTPSPHGRRYKFSRDAHVLFIGSARHRLEPVRRESRRATGLRRLGGGLLASSDHAFPPADTRSQGGERDCRRLWSAGVDLELRTPLDRG